MSQETPASYFAAAFEAIALSASTLSWPHPKYEKDPTAFARDILAMELWGKQIEIATSVVRNRKTSVRSGHKIGKSLVCAVLALWFYCTFPRARVFLTGPTFTQVDDVLWREIKILIQRSGTCLDCRRAADLANPEYPQYPRPCPHSAIIPEEPHITGSGGLVSTDHRQITAHTADKPEAMAGRSGVYILYVVDEASGVNEGVFEVIQGNLASKGARAIYISNPTRTEGTFYESQTSKKDQYHVIHVSSEEAARLGIDGLATPVWIKETADLYGGTDSGQYIIRVKGDFAPEHSQKVIPRSLIDDALIAWDVWKRSGAKADGPLSLGCDIAGFGADDTAIAVRRGNVILEVISRNGLSEDQTVDLILATADAYRAEREICTIKIDAAGIGIPVLIKLNKRAGRFHRIIGLHPGEAARLPNEYAYLRDQLWFSCAQWLREGGCLPPEPRMEAELHAPIYSLDARNRRKVESKDITRKQLKRSPDRADAVCLAVWDESTFQPQPVGIGARPDPYKEPPARQTEREAIYGVHGSFDERASIYGPRR